MRIEPKFIQNVCTVAHPQGCKQHVEEQIAYLKGRTKPKEKGPKRVLIIGGSAGYGLASRIAAAYGYGAKTFNVAYEKPASNRRTATVGWYNTHAFEDCARKDGLYAETLFADAFLSETKQETISRIKQDIGELDLIIYSLAAGRRTDQSTDTMYTSALKPIGAPYSAKSVNLASGEVIEAHVNPATEEEIFGTVKVMGGEDWEEWITVLDEANLIAPNAYTLAYSYIGPRMTYPLYREGTIGKAKEHLEASVKTIDKIMSKHQGKAFVSVNKALATRASAVIPVVPLYVSILYKVMKEKGLHETCIEQIHRLFGEHLYTDNATINTDSEGRIRIDDREMRDDVQAEVSDAWGKISSENIDELSDIKGFQREFWQLHGFAYDNIDYSADIEP